MDPVRCFLDRSIHHLREEYLPRLEQAVSTLPPADLWWRPHPEANSVGNLLLHLEGNVRQWILAGLGGRPDRRARAAEFDATAGADGAALLAALRATVEEACELIEALPPASMTEIRHIQCFDTEVLAAIYHVVEHFSWHTGQVTYVAKLRGGEAHGLAFYDGQPLDQTAPDPPDGT